MTIIYKNPAKTLNYDNYINYVKSRKYQTKTNYAIVTKLNSLVQQVQKSLLNVSIELISQQESRYFCQSKKMQELDFAWFSALLFPKLVLKAVRCIDKATRV